MSSLPAWRAYICQACGYVYHERDGDVESGLAPGTRFEDIPADWYCPICGVTKADFVLLQKQPLTLKATPPAAIPSASKAFDVVIVGGGIAGWRAVEALRALSSELSIALISTCEADRYDKPLLSVAVSKKLPVSTLVKETGVVAAQRLGVTLWARTTAVNLDTSSRSLRTTRGGLRYQHLIIAHGAQATLPKPLAPEHCWRINHLDHYKKFRAVIDGSPKALLIVGAGLVGSELSNDLALAGHSITLIDMADRPLARVLSDQAQCNALMKAWASLPIRFLGQTQVVAVTKITTATATATAKDITTFEVTLSGGERLTVDAIVVATGLQTQNVLAKSAGLRFDNGIVVEAVTLRTSAPDVFALGDCISIEGDASRFIEPLSRQAMTIASQILSQTLIPYVQQRVPVRIKTSAWPITVA